MNDQLFWFVTRGAGIVSLILTTSVVYLGILSVLTPTRVAHRW